MRWEEHIRLRKRSQHLEGSPQRRVDDLERERVGVDGLTCHDYERDGLLCHDEGAENKWVLPCGTNV